MRIISFYAPRSGQRKEAYEKHWQEVGGRLRETFRRDRVILRAGENGKITGATWRKNEDRNIKRMANVTCQYAKTDKAEQGNGYHFKKTMRPRHDTGDDVDGSSAAEERPAAKPRSAEHNAERMEATEKREALRDMGNP